MTYDEQISQEIEVAARAMCITNGWERDALPGFARRCRDIGRQEGEEHARLMASEEHKP